VTGPTEAVGAGAESDCFPLQPTKAIHGNASSRLPIRISGDRMNIVMAPNAIRVFEKHR
jgi:hypothetical protein